MRSNKSDRAFLNAPPGSADERDAGIISRRKLDEILTAGADESTASTYCAPARDRLAREYFALAREVDYLRGTVTDLEQRLRGDGRLVQMTMSTEVNAVAPGASAVISTRPQHRRIKLHRLFIDEGVAASFDIIDVRIGNRSALQNPGPISAMLFCRGIGHTFTGDEVQTAQDVVMDVRNTGTSPMIFTATWTVIEFAEGPTRPPRRTHGPHFGAQAPMSTEAWWGIVGGDGDPPARLSPPGADRIVDRVVAGGAIGPPEAPVADPTVAGGAVGPIEAWFEIVGPPTREIIAKDAPAGPPPTRDASRPASVPTGAGLIGWDPYGDD